MIAVVSSAFALLIAIGVVRQRDPVIATILFIPVLICIGVVYLAIGAHALGLVQLLIFVPVIFLFLKKAILELPDPNIRRDPLPFIYPVAAGAIIALGLILVIDLGSVILDGTFSIQLSPRSFSDLVVVIPQYFSGWSYALLLILLLAIAVAVSAVHLRREKSVRKGGGSGLGNEGGEA